MFVVSEAWKQAYPRAAIGVLAMGHVVNPGHHDGLQRRKEALEGSLRERYAGMDRAGIKALPVMQAYDRYYKQFKKSYHVQLQLESVVFKGKPIPSVAALVEAMFMAELDDLLLTAGHDLEIVQPPVRIDVADGSECYVRINGQEQQLKAGDMVISDREGVLSSIIYGPDQRTQIGPGTRQVLFTTYAPPGIGAGSVEAHLEHMRDNVLVFSPEAEVILLAVYAASA